MAIREEAAGIGADSMVAVVEPEEQPLLAPVTPTMSWTWVHSLSQSRPREPNGPADVDSLAVIRRSATIRRGTRMIKLLSARQFSGYLVGRRPSGFCYRAYDLLPLRGQSPLAMLIGDSGHTDLFGTQVVYGLRWRATDPCDYHIPFSYQVGSLPAYPGLATISPHDRLGPPILGTGFAPSSQHLVPEFVTADLADLPIPAGAALVAFTPDDLEISLYVYIPEQRGWTRMFGPQWRHLVADIPEVSHNQEYVQCTIDHTGGSMLLGHYQGQLYEALADPPRGYRVLSRARAARYPVSTLTRRTRYVRWRDADCTVVRTHGDWLRLRLCRPDASASMLGAQCVERGVYEVWVSAEDVTVHDVDVEYLL